jgi:hypothetical protein
MAFPPQWPPEPENKPWTIGEVLLTVLTIPPMYIMVFGFIGMALYTIYRICKALMFILPFFLAAVFLEWRDRRKRSRRG